MTKSLRRIVYRSTATIADDDVAALDAIFTSSVRNNRRDKITGCLAHPDGKFVQVLEGDAQKLDELMTRIRADKRHKDIIVLNEWPIKQRLFPSWAMARPDRTPLSQQAFNIVTQDGTAAQVVSILLNVLHDAEKHYHRPADLV